MDRSLTDLLATASVRLEPAGRKHARQLARCMREKDKIEIRASGGFIPEPAVRASINRSEEAYAAYVGDDLIAVFGVVRHAKQGVSIPWAMTSEHLPQHALTFWRASKLTVNYLRDRHPCMMNMIHARYTEALNWLARLGFKICQPETYGRSGDLFCRAELYTDKLEVARV